MMLHDAERNIKNDIRMPPGVILYQRRLQRDPWFACGYRKVNNAITPGYHYTTNHEKTTMPAHSATTPIAVVPLPSVPASRFLAAFYHAPVAPLRAVPAGSGSAVDARNAQ